APVGPRLVLAGEATSVEHPSTVPGALLSGRRAAEQLADELDPADGPVVVVGAGVAGLAAARDLIDAGFEVVVLDARDRVGGRVTSTDLGGVPVDLGAGWIEGTDGNPMTAIVEDLGVGLVETDWSDAVVRLPGGATVAHADVVDAVDAVDVAIGAAVADAGDGEDDRPFDELLAQQLGFSLDEASGEAQTLLVWAVDSAITYDLAADPAQLGAVGVDEGEPYDGPEMMLRGGYGQVPAALADGVAVRLGAVVAEVAHDDAGVMVTLDDGTTVDAAAAVVTVPIGVLQAGELTFVPSLPAPVRAAIEALDMGVLTKVFVRFDDVFWDDDVDVIGFLDPDEPGRWATWVNLTELTGAPILLG
ncbi:MAG: FAD-dependent oxidoreductase, partial [Acidimicrobiales bacterium]|nr:FAD-dependent oxidoreductase [Acidimicrobiales bacterium]